MIYVMSDIRGDYERYAKMLKKIRLSGRDTLYILGNVIDGGDSMKLLLDMMMRENVYPVIGDHEFAALKCLNWLMNDVTEDSVANIDPKVMGKMADWIAIGGQKTIAQFKALDEEKKEMIVDYLSDFSLYEEVTANDKEFVLVHAGIANFAPDKDMDDYDIRELITQAPDYGKTYFEDRILVTGHTPTRRIYEEDNPLIEATVEGESSSYDKVFAKNNHIAVNCGVSIGGRLGAVRLDDMKEFYVD